MEMNTDMNDKPQENSCGSEETMLVRGPDYSCARDMLVQIKTAELLEQTGWYYGNFTKEDAERLLQKEPEGTFLVRDSSDPRCLYSLSVKTSRGATSARILYRKGKFILDCMEPSSANTPKFDSVVHLVDFFVRWSQKGRGLAGSWAESSGEINSPIVLQKPKPNRVLDLEHLCRLSVNRNLPNTMSRTKVYKNMDMLPIPKPLKSYLKEYPHIN